MLKYFFFNFDTLKLKITNNWFKSKYLEESRSKSAGNNSPATILTISPTATLFHLVVYQTGSDNPVDLNTFIKKSILIVKVLVISNSYSSLGSKCIRLGSIFSLISKIILVEDQIYFPRYKYWPNLSLRLDKKLHVFCVS